MNDNSSSIISKVWSFCNTLRDDGVSYGDYLEQLTYLLFLKMANELSRPLYNRALAIPNEFNWESLTNKKGAELEAHYSTLLREFAKEKGILGQIFIKSQNKIQDPAKLSRLIDMIDKEEWSTMGADIKMIRGQTNFFPFHQCKSVKSVDGHFFLLFYLFSPCAPAFVIAIRG